MKRLLALISVAMLIPIAVYGQATNIAAAKDSMSGADLDTLLYDVSFTYADYSDTNAASFFMFKLDTIKQDTATAGRWLDSAWINKVTAEFRYLLPRNERHPEDTLSALRSSGSQWLPIIDSLNAVNKWGWVPVKLLPLSDRGQLRIRQANTTKVGPRHGTWVEFIWRMKQDN